MIYETRKRSYRPVQLDKVTHSLYSCFICPQQPTSTILIVESMRLIAQAGAVLFMRLKPVVKFAVHCSNSLSAAGILRSDLMIKCYWCAVSCKHYRLYKLSVKRSLVGGA